MVKTKYRPLDPGCQGCRLVAMAPASTESRDCNLGEFSVTKWGRKRSPSRAPRALWLVPNWAGRGLPDMARQGGDCVGGILLG